MLALISPAKNLDYVSPLATSRYSTPEFLDDAEKLINQLKPLSAKKIGNLMNLSDRLSTLNSERYQAWRRPFTPENARPAILAFNGDVYAGLDAKSLGDEDFSYAQKNLRILSGLYGLLKPLDLMQPYRLEMGTLFANRRGKNLYAFWGNKITEKINQVLSEQNSRILVNLASTEYFKSVHPKIVQGKIITPQFRDEKNGQYKIISFFAKKARGMMAAYLIKNRIRSLADLKGFQTSGYYYSDKDSSDTKPVFLRDEVTRANL